MSLLQVKVDDKLKKAIKKKAKVYGVPATSLIRIVLVKSFLLEDDVVHPGNVFNAERDNNGRGLSVDSMVELL